MKVVVAIAVIAFAAGAIWYCARFVREVRAIKREIEQIRRSGHAKSAIRKMRRERSRSRRRR